MQQHWPTFPLPTSMVVSPLLRWEWLVWFGARDRRTCCCCCSSKEDDAGRFFVSLANSRPPLGGFRSFLCDRIPSVGEGHPRG